MKTDLFEFMLKVKLDNFLKIKMQKGLIGKSQTLEEYKQHCQFHALLILQTKSVEACLGKQSERLKIGQSTKVYQTKKVLST